MLEQLDLERVLVLDIETVSQQPEFEALASVWQELWRLKAVNLKGADQQTPEELYSRAGIYAEFGKIVCISVGIFRAYDEHFQ
ncbi:MAG: 3'-5' exonuclease, partial [Bacteroidota bacterium]|nr:3'-5' exonuclease [Bacteroidota bacterium]MDX5468925.1 3'-5' exonuclease [Bacteroidota bacterium]